jgi:putative PIN family toxin of toxin-antitoxin system
VVVDTGVLVSAFAFGGVPQKALSHVLGTADVYVSPALLEEYRAVPGALLAEEKVTVTQWQTLIAGIASVVAEAKVVFPQKTVTVCRDPEDDMILECCLAAHADLLVTGDKDLLELSSGILRRIGHRKLLVLSPRVYLDSAAE